MVSLEWPFFLAFSLILFGRIPPIKMGVSPQVNTTPHTLELPPALWSRPHVPTGGPSARRACVPVLQPPLLPPLRNPRHGCPRVLVSPRQNSRSILIGPSGTPIWGETVFLRVCRFLMGRTEVNERSIDSTPFSAHKNHRMMFYLAPESQIGMYWACISSPMLTWIHAHTQFIHTFILPCNLFCVLTIPLWGSYKIN
jgi:hypothetical protein